MKNSIYRLCIIFSFQIENNILKIIYIKIKHSQMTNFLLRFSDVDSSSVWGKKVFQILEYACGDLFHSLL